MSQATKDRDLVDLLKSQPFVAKFTALVVEWDWYYHETDIKLYWDTSRVYDSFDYVSYAGDEDELAFMSDPEYIDVDDLRDLLGETFQWIDQNHQGFVEEGVSDISEGVYRIRIHSTNGESL